MEDTLIKKHTGMKAETLEDLSAEYVLVGVKIREQLFKKILKKSRQWAQVAFVFRNVKEDTEKLMIGTFLKRAGYWTRNSYIIIDMEDIKVYKDLLDEIS